MKPLHTALNFIKNLFSRVKNNRHEIFKSFKKLVIILNGIVVFFVLIYFFYPEDDFSSEEAYSEESTENCNVLGINLHGSLETYIPKKNEDEVVEGYEDYTASESVMLDIEYANNQKSVKAILLEVDSYGGTPVAGEEIAEAIKNSKKPVYALIRQSGLSAAYWAVTPAKTIFASKNSEIGSIGVTQSYLDNVGMNQKEGLSFVELSMGKFKDSGSTDKKLTEEERALFMRDLKIIYENFVSAVAENRNLPVEQVRAVADGSTVLGERAKEHGLIDEIGGYYDLKKRISADIGEGVKDCW